MTDDPILAEIHAGLERDGYYIEATLMEEFSSSQLAELRDDLAAADQTTYVVAYPLRETDTFRGNANDLLARLHDAYPEPGIYLSTTSYLRQEEDASIRLEGRQYDLPGRRDGSLSDYQVTSIVALEDPPNLGAAFLRSVELLELDSSSLYELETEARGQARDRDGSDGDHTGLVIALLPAALVAAIVVVVVRRWRRGLPALSAPPSPTRATDRSAAGAPLSLPSSTLDRIRDAQDRALAEEARDEVLELGVAIDRVRLTTEVERAGWQVAVDHYQAARDVLEALQSAEQEPDVLDVVGALVLARRAQEALLAARRGRRWKPQAPCFLHPLHPRSVALVSIGASREKVPVCADCRADLQAGRTPAVLQARNNSRLAPYYETDAEPWASTGYGALVPDLLSAVHRHDPT